MHESGAHAATLDVRPDRQRSEREDRRAPDMPAGAEHMPDHLTARRGRHQRKGRQPRLAGAEFVHQPRLNGRIGLVWPGESGGRDVPDRRGIRR